MQTAQSPIQALHPSSLSESQLNSYAEEFEFAFSDPSIRNIALSGAYGAGKSTVVNSWEDSVRKKKETDPWVHVSLSNYSGQKERDVESELINQLTHKLDLSNAPKSRFVVTRDSTCVLNALKTILLLIAVILTAALVIVWSDKSIWMSNSALSAVLTVAWGVVVGLFVFAGLKRKSLSKTIKRLKVFNAEVEVFERDEKADAFDVYLDDIVYLLSNSISDVIVFEDLDRFGDISVFEKLRRVNELVNARLTEKRRHRRGCSCCNRDGDGRTMRFIYLVRDSLFADPKDRTKFFDLIIPVIPFVDPNNSYDVLNKGLANAGVEVDESFLYQLSLYIDDPRILKDICNESRHFKRVLHSQEEGKESYWDDNKLVAMMSYRALFPADYESLQIRRGYVYSLFARKAELMQKVRESIRNDIEKLQQELDSINDKLAFNEDELKLLYLSLEAATWREITSSAYRIERCGSARELLEEIGSNPSSNSKLDAALEKLNDNPEFVARMKEITNQADRRSVQVEEKIKSAEDEILVIDRWSLSEFLESVYVNADDFFDAGHSDHGAEAEETLDDFTAVTEHKYFPMLRFLIAQGFIDETYQLYMSKRYNESLSSNDEGFLFSLLGGSRADSEKEIDNAYAVVLRLTPELLSRRGARNRDIFDELVQNGPVGKREAFVRGIAHDHDSQFVCACILSDCRSTAMFNALADGYESCASDVLDDPNIDGAQKRSFCHVLLGEKIADSLMDVSGDSVRVFAQSDSDFLDLGQGLQSSATALGKGLAKIGYRADAIHFDTANKALVKYVAREGLFVPLKSLVLGMARVVAEDGSIHLADLNTRLASDERLRSSRFRRHVLDGVEDYLQTLISNKDNGPQLEDTDEAIAMILNAFALESEELVRGYARMLKKPLNDLSLVESPGWKSVLLEESKCADTAENVCAYAVESGLDDSLAQFLSRGAPEGLSAAFMESHGVDAERFIKASALSESLSENAFAELASGYGAKVDASVASSAEEARAKIFIDCGLVEVTGESIDIMRRGHPKLVVLMASENLRAYVDLVLAEGNSCDFSEEEAMELFEMPGLDSRQLGRLVSGLRRKIPLSSGYSDEVNLSLLENGKFDGNLPPLPDVYENASGKSLKNEVAGVIADHVSETPTLDMSEELEKDVASRLSGNADAAKSFIANRIVLHGQGVSRGSVIGLLRDAGLSEYAKLLEGTQFYLVPSQADNDLIKALQDAKMCGVLGGPDARGKCRVNPKGFQRVARKTGKTR